jgi:pyruvate dehydrogenase E1 component beta subunit
LPRNDSALRLQVNKALTQVYMGGDIETIYAHYPGLVVMTPATVEDAYSMLLEAVAIDDPVIFCEHKNLYGAEVDVPAESYAIPFGEANVVRDGKHATIVTYGMMVHRAMEAAATLAKQGIECEVIDLRTLSPIDWDTVIDSAERTGHVVCVDEAHPRCSIAADVSAMVTQECFKALKGPIQMVTAPHTPVPFSPVLEDLYIPSADAIAKAVKKSMGK